jgi:phosphonoacetaldehyde hydrolase
MRCAAVIFDWAGTMVDFGSRAPVVAMQQAFEAEGVPVSEAEVRAAMGRAKRDHVAQMLANTRIEHAWRDRHGAAPSEADIDRIFARIEPLMRVAGAAHATLVPGAAHVARELQSAGVPIGSTTGYTRAMMGPIIEAAKSQGYAPDVIVCAGETAFGRPSPLMIWKALLDLGAWPASAVVKVDDAPVGIAEGRNAGCFTIGVAASGNANGLDAIAFAALSDVERAARLAAARSELLAAGADLVIDTVADLPAALRDRGWLWQDV